MRATMGFFALYALVFLVAGAFGRPAQPAANPEEARATSRSQVKLNFFFGESPSGTRQRSCDVEATDDSDGSGDPGLTPEGVEKADSGEPSTAGSENCVSEMQKKARHFKPS